ncbi:MAG: PIN domain-containing protein [Bryobacteraceae bacterium]
MMGVLLDSVILIDHLNGIPAAGAYLAALRGASISVITRAEVLAGTESEHLEAVKRLLDKFPVLAIDRTVADTAAALRRENRWRLPDAFQASLAHIHKLQLATRNTKDFPPAKFPWVLIPYALK